MVVVVQLVRTPDCGSGGRRFESGLPPKSKPSIYRGFFCCSKHEFLNEFESLVYPLFEKVVLNEKVSQELAQLRDWLLPMLMNGQVMVNS